VWYDLLSDGLSSTTVVVTSTGVVAAQLFAPYGQGRWAGGTMPTSYAFTGQRADSTTGLDYYGARYYDPAAGTFTSADTASGKSAGLNRYGYVSGNPETLTDPTGHLPGTGGGQGICKYDPDGGECQGSGGGGHGGGGGNGGSCRTDASCGGYIGETPTCPPGIYVCGFPPGQHNPGKQPSLLRQSGQARQDSDTLVGIGGEGLSQLISILTLLDLWLQQQEINGLKFPNGAGILSGALWTASAVIAILAALADPASVIATAGVLLVAGLNVAAGALAVESAQGSATDSSDPVYDAVTTLSQLQTAIPESMLDHMTFMVEEIDYYAQGTFWSCSYCATVFEPDGEPPPGQFIDAIWTPVGHGTDYSQVTSVYFQVTYTYTP
jgi:RHS repeat-associated protein